MPAAPVAPIPDVACCDRLEHALVLVAGVVDRHGETYLPIYERLERELDIAKRRTGALERAKRLARTKP